MTANYHTLNQVVAPVAIPEVVLLFMSFRHLLVLGMQLLIWQVLYSPSVLMKTPQNSSFSHDKANRTASLSYLRGIPTVYVCWG